MSEELTDVYSVESVVDDVVSVEEYEYESEDESSDESEKSFESDEIEETIILKRTHEYVFVSYAKKISL